MRGRERRLAISICPLEEDALRDGAVSLIVIIQAALADRGGSLARGLEALLEAAEGRRGVFDPGMPRPDAEGVAQEGPLA